MFLPNDIRLAVVCAHPDDELGCLGTIHRLSRNHDFEIKMICVCDMVEDHVVTEESRAQYRYMYKESGKNLGADVEFLGYHTEILYSDFRDAMIDIYDSLVSFRPNILFFPSGKDLHQDHRALHEEIKFSLRSRSLSDLGIQKAYVMELPSATGQRYDEAFSPDQYVPLKEDDLAFKIDLLNSVYEAEVGETPYHPRSARGLRIIAEKRGLECGAQYAEAFEVYKGVWFE